MVVPPELDVVPLDPDEDEDDDDDDDDDVLPEDEDEELLLAVPFDPLDPLEPLEPEDDGVGASTFVSGLSPGSVGLVDVAVPPEGGGAEPVPPYGPPSGGSLLPLQPVMAATAIALVSAKRESDARVVVVHIMASYLRFVGRGCGSRSALFVAHSDRSSSQHRQAADRCDRNETFEA